MTESEIRSHDGPEDAAREREAALTRRHLMVGWTLIATYILLGTLLEALHGLKLGWYLDLSHETRRLLLRLAHAHGVLLGIVNICLALSLPYRRVLGRAEARWVSLAVVAGSIALPLGFLLGGLVIYGGDPNPAILLSPIGAVFLLVGLLGFARGFWTARPGPR